jgi:dihydropteroate synthase
VTFRLFLENLFVIIESYIQLRLNNLNIIDDIYQSNQPVIMGILNVTPDSFSDGMQYTQVDKAIKYAEKMLIDGADIIDVGGESTRPGAAEVSVSEEISRVVPLIKKLKSLGCLISVDTSKAEVMQAAADAGADMINDVRALSLPGAMSMLAKLGLPVCLMHMQGQPLSMQLKPAYSNVVEDVLKYLRRRIEICVEAGIPQSLISVDPGFGFGKTLQHNIDLLRELSGLNVLNSPVLVGLSRKSMIGQITESDVCDRLSGSLAAALIAMQQGAKIIRVHDVKQTVDVKKIYLATK